MNLLIALFSGLLFGAGLVLSDMMNPARVLAFLDVAGAWDYSLALVMGAALLPSALAWWLRRRMQTPLCAARFATPAVDRIDLPLVGGALLFGLGWGLSGFCPGPAVVAPLSGQPQALWFLAAMLTGMVVHRLTLGRTATAVASDGSEAT